MFPHFSFIIHATSQNAPHATPPPARGSEGGGQGVVHDARQEPLQHLLRSGEAHGGTKHRRAATAALDCVRRRWKEGRKEGGGGLICVQSIKGSD